jgi:hypothetical protein
VVVFGGCVLALLADDLLGALMGLELLLLWLLLRRDVRVFFAMVDENGKKGEEADGSCFVGLSTEGTWGNYSREVADGCLKFSWYR